MTASTLPALAPDLLAGLTRLKLSRIRALAPELLQTAKTQRWTPEEFLRTLVEAEIAARDTANQTARLKAAAFPAVKSLDSFKVAHSSVPQATVDYLASLEWIRAKENCCLVGPAGTGKSHLLVAVGAHAVAAGYRVRYFVAAQLIETLYRGLADNSVGRVLDQLLRHDLIIIDELGFAPLDPVGSQSLALRPMGSLLPRPSHRRVTHRPLAPSRRYRRDSGRVLPYARSSDASSPCFACSPNPRRAPGRAYGMIRFLASGGYFCWPQTDTSSWPLTNGATVGSCPGLTVRCTVIPGATSLPAWGIWPITIPPDVFDSAASC